MVRMNQSRKTKKSLKNMDVHGLGGFIKQIKDDLKEFNIKEEYYLNRKNIEKEFLNTRLLRKKKGNKRR